jgi:hypothetical protein
MSSIFHFVLVAFFLLNAFTSSVQAAPVVRKYTIYTQNMHKAGEQIVTQEGNVVKVKYSYKDNGRGPDLTEEIKLGDNGIPISYTAQGTTTFGSTVNESFSQTKENAVWNSTSEKGETKITEPGFYVPLNSSFEVSSLMINALTKRKDLRLPLFPSGELRQKKISQLTVRNGSKSKKIQLIAQTGLGLSPNFYWATVDANPQLFGIVYPGYMWTVEEGWQDSIPKMEEAQVKTEKKLLAQMATRLKHSMKGSVVIKNAKVFDSTTAQLSAPMDIYIKSGKIVELKPANLKPAKSKNEIDVQGRVVTPGLYDMHAHIWRWDGGLHLAAGVTTIRDMANNNEQMKLMKEELAAGKLFSPNIVSAGFIEGKSPYSANLGVVIKDLNEAKKAIDMYAQRGDPQIKIYNSFPKEILKETVDYAHAKGLRVSGHVPAFLRAEEVINAGYDEIQHINQVLLNFLVKPETDTRDLSRFYLPAEKVADLDFDYPKVKEFLKLLKDRQTVIDPTIATFEFIHKKDGELSPGGMAIADHMPIDVKRRFFQADMKIPDEQTAKRYKKSFDKCVEFIGLMYKNQIPLVAGTDGLPGFTLHTELEYYVKAGLTPSQALQIATLNGAKYSKTSNDRGSIAPGMRSDLVVFDADPTQDISNIRKVALVFQGENMIYPNEVYKEYGIKPFVNTELKPGPTVH